MNFGKDVNFGLSAAAVSGGAGARGWVDDGPGRCVAHPAIPSGAPVESGLAHHSALQGMPLPRRALGEFDGPTTNCIPVTHRLSSFTCSTRKQLQSVMASGFAPGWVGPMGHGVCCCDLGGCSVLQCMRGARARQLCAIPSPGKL